MRPTWCHGQCINAPEGVEPFRRTFNLECGGCREHKSERAVAAAKYILEPVPLKHCRICLTTYGYRSTCRCVQP